MQEVEFNIMDIIRTSGAFLRRIAANRPIRPPFRSGDLVQISRSSPHLPVKKF